MVIVVICLVGFSIFIFIQALLIADQQASHKRRIDLLELDTKFMLNSIEELSFDQESFDERLKKNEQRISYLAEELNKLDTETRNVYSYQGLIHRKLKDIEKEKKANKSLLQDLILKERANYLQLKTLETILKTLTNENTINHKKSN